MLKIVLIGAGNIGSRHLQALANLDRDAIIQVVDPADAALSLAKERFESVYVGKSRKIEVQYLHEITGIDPQADLAILATSAKPRRGIAEYIAKNTDIKKLILEKVVFQSVEDLYEVKALFREKNIRAWVDCIRRNYTFYKELKAKLSSEENINMEVDGGNWGMGCNGIHELDLYAFLTGEQSFTADTSYLDPDILDSKRAGYREFTGTEIFRCLKGMLTVRSTRDSTARGYTTVTSDNYYYVIDEGNGKAWFLDRNGETGMQELPVDCRYVSQVTNINVQDIMDKGTCDLTGYGESVYLHEVILNAFTEFINRQKGEALKICPVT